MRVGNHKLPLLAPELDHRTSLTASELETVASQEPNVFSECLGTPYDPH